MKSPRGGVRSSEGLGIGLPFLDKRTLPLRLGPAGFATSRVHSVKIGDHVRGRKPEFTKDAAQHGPAPPAPANTMHDDTMPRSPGFERSVDRRPDSLAFIALIGRWPTADEILELLGEG